MRMQMMQIRSLMFLLVAALTMAVPARPQGVEDQCLAVLTETGRNRLQQLDEEDRETYFFKKVCKGSQGNSGIDFAYAGAVLGFDHAKATSYCSAHQSREWRSATAHLDTSTVVETALSSWLECIRLTRKGVRIEPTLGKEVASFSFSRTGTAAGIVKGVVTGQGTQCRGHLPVDPSNPAKTEYSLLSASIDFTLPVASAWNVTCTRSSIPSPTHVGAVIFPETTIAFDTSEGVFSVRLDEEPRASSAWATMIGSRLDALEGRVEDNDSATRAAVSSLASRQLRCRGLPREEHQSYRSCPSSEFLLARWCSGDCGSDDAKVSICCEKPRTD